MQRIELQEKLIFPRCLLDLTVYLATQPTTQQVLMYFEASLEQGYDTFLLPTNELALAIIDDVLLQRPYLKNQLQFVCVLTPKQGSMQWQTNYQAIMNEAEQLQLQLEVSTITIGLIDGRDALFDPVAIAQAIDELVDQKAVGSFGVREMTNEQVEILQLYCEQPIHFRLQPFDLNLIKDFQKQASFFRHQMFPLIYFTKNLEELAQERLDELTAYYNVRCEAIFLAWLLFHPLTVMPVFESHFGKNWQQAYREQQQIELSPSEWYEINQRLS
ncbi:MAG: hypothetical protein ACRCZG_00555 [Culicoidibacterales bacterium]